MHAAEQAASGHPGAPGWRLTLAQAPLAWPPGAGQAHPLAPLDAALLAWLAIEGATARAHMATLLWPEADAESARNSLRQRLFKLKRQLGVALVDGSTVLQLAPGLLHDLADADSVLAEQQAPLGAEFDQWLAQQRDHRQSRRLQGLVELCETAEKARDWTEALGHAKTLLALAPLSEAAHRRLIRLHYLAGDRAAALLAFDQCEQRLKHEVGTRPSAETLALLATVEQSQIDEPAVPLWTGRVPAAVQHPPRLIGRSAEWAALQAAWAARHTVLITGQGGLGKTRLATDFAQHSGNVVLASARPGDPGVAHASLVRWLRALPREAWVDLPKAVQRELGRLLPELAPATDTDTTPVDPDRLGHAVGAVLARLAPAVGGAVFDDLHFADEASLDLLHYLVPASGWRWVLTARADELSPAGQRLVDSLGAHADNITLALQPLSEPQVAELLDSLGLDGLETADLAPRLTRHSGGNPLFLLETLKTWLAQGRPAWAAAGPGPYGGSRQHWPAVPNLQGLIERRISRLSSAAVQLARCAAVAAPDFSIALAAHVLGRRTIELTDAWAELEAAQVLVGTAFAHDLIHEAALASVPPVVARALHGEIAEFLAGQGGEPLRLARHWTQAENWSPAGTAFVAAAARARDAARLMEQAALLAEAADAFDRAGQPTQRFDALLQRARTLASNNAGSQAQVAVAALQALATTEMQQLQVLDARCLLAINRSETTDTLHLSQQALAAAKALGRFDLEARYAGFMADALCDLRRAAEAVALLAPYAERVRQQADDADQWHYWNAVGLALDYANRLRDALPAWDEALAAAQRARHNDRIWMSLSNAASTLAKTGQVQRAAEVGARVVQLGLAADEGISLRLRSAHVTWAHRLRDLGRFAEALPLLEDALVHFRQGGSPAEQASVENRLAQLFQWLGQPGRAATLLVPEHAGLAPGLAMMRLVHRADVAHQRGQGGLALMREALRLIDTPDDIYHRIASLFATRLVPPDEGEALATSLAAWASARERLGVALAGHVRAAACALAQDAPRRALPHVEAALHLAEARQPDSFYLPELWLVAAQVYQALGQTGAAQQQLQTGVRWVTETAQAQVPEAFRDSFLQRNAVNAALLAMAAQAAS